MADPFDHREVIVRRDAGPGGGAADGLRDERGDVLRTDEEDHALELVHAGHLAIRVGVPQRAVVAER